MVFALLLRFFVYAQIIKNFDVICAHDIMTKLKTTPVADVYYSDRYLVRIDASTSTFWTGSGHPRFKPI